MATPSSTFGNGTVGSEMGNVNLSEGSGVF